MNKELKFKKLESLINEYTKEDVVVAFSGGVDSSLLLKLSVDKAKNHNTKVYGVTFVADLQPHEDLGITDEVCKEIGATHIVLQLSQLDIAAVRENHIDRCYHCKRTLFSSLLEYAHSLNINTVIDGTNADDLLSYRPGIKALEDLKIISPLRVASLSKSEVREMAGRLGISVAQRPSSPCLATRFEYNTHLDIESIKMVEKGEAYLRNIASRNFRVRMSGLTARIECDTDIFDAVIKKKEEIIEYFKEIGFEYISLDLEGFRSGSMDSKMKF
ncbi:MAG: ATP-dependent sacrificial sulfur transferase LarE [Spirochaetaceae bacterium]|nr:ATP-dependent sacrificial sulfur transferase LarE [Spirochaetaceae bacterium]